MAETRTQVPYNATLATKDAQCVSEFGSDYQTASLRDFILWYGSGAVPLSTSMTFGYDATSSVYLYYSNSTYKITENPTSSNSSVVFCVKK